MFNHTQSIIRSQNKTVRICFQDGFLYMYLVFSKTHGREDNKEDGEKLYIELYKIKQRFVSFANRRKQKTAC